MEFQEVVRRRKMVRSFTPRPVASEIVARILANAQRAPSAGYSQGWGFLVLEAADDRRRFWDVTEDAASGPARTKWPSLRDAPVLVICLSDKEHYLARYSEPDKGWTDRDERRWPVPYWHLDTAMAALLMLLTAVDAGLGALFFGIVPERLAAFREAFAVPERLTPIGVVAVGYAAPSDPPSPSLRRGRRPEAEVVRRGRWGRG
jgi:nitroreductase